MTLLLEDMIREGLEFQERLEKKNILVIERYLRMTEPKTILQKAWYKIAPCQRISRNIAQDVLEKKKGGYS